MKVKVKQAMYDRKSINKVIGNLKNSFDEISEILNSKKK